MAKRNRRVAAGFSHPANFHTGNGQWIGATKFILPKSPEVIRAASYDCALPCADLRIDRCRLVAASKWSFSDCRSVADAVVFVRIGKLVGSTHCRAELHSGDSGGDPWPFRVPRTDCEAEGRTRRYGFADADNHRLGVHRSAGLAPLVDCQNPARQSWLANHHPHDVMCVGGAAIDCDIRPLSWLGHHVATP